MNPKAGALRPLAIEIDVMRNPEGSARIAMGETVVLCSASVDEKVPPFLKGTGKGWVTAEYSMLPRSTNDRMAREAARGKQSGRTMEIQRLIGRALRAVVDLDSLGERTVIVDCDVLEADGGTRTASITGGAVALHRAFTWLVEQEKLRFHPMRDLVGAVSVGIVGGAPVLDLCYAEDSRAQVDLNVVMTGDGRFVEVQGTAEESPFTPAELETMLGLARTGLADIHQAQRRVLGIAEGRPA